MSGRTRTLPCLSPAGCPQLHHTQAYLCPQDMLWLWQLPRLTEDGETSADIKHRLLCRLCVCLLLQNRFPLLPPCGLGGEAGAEQMTW